MRRDVELEGRATTIIASVERYFDREEAKSFPPNGLGELKPWQLQILGHRYIGKETNSRLADLVESTDGIIGAWKEQVFDRDHFGDGHDELRARVKAIGAARIAQFIGMRRTAVYDFLKGRRVTHAWVVRIGSAVAHLSPNVGEMPVIAADDARRARA